MDKSQLEALLASAGMKYSYPKFDKVGDYVAGVLVEKRKNDVPDPYGHKKYEYILLDGDTRYLVGGRAYPKGSEIGRDYKVIFGMSDIPVGAEMAFVFTEEIPSKTKGNKPTKVITPKYIGVTKPEVVAEYKKRYATSDVAEDTQETGVELKDTGEELTLDDIPFAG